MERYAVGAAIGIALSIAMLVPYITRNSAFTRAIAETIILYSLTMGILCFWFAGPQPFQAGAERDSLFLSRSRSEPVVIEDPLVFSPTWWYSDEGERKTMFYLYDLKFAAMQPDSVPEYSLFLEQPFGAPLIHEYGVFTQAHREFLLYCSGMRGRIWIKDRLLAEGWELTLLGSEGKKELYRARKAPGSNPTPK
jgi:hypothetical protein